MAEGQSTVEYRNVPGFPDYRAGDDGSLWSRKRGRLGAQVWRRLRGTLNDRQRVCVKLCRDGRIHIRLLHNVILETFVGPRPSGMDGCHYPDPDPRNCALSNLRWDTKKANAADKIVHGTAPVGERNPRAKLTADKVRQIRQRIESGEPRPAVAAEFGVALSTVDMVVERRTWAHV